jgi:dipeptidyl aminopeptidase/acylaminoacyl peptidase
MRALRVLAGAVLALVSTASTCDSNVGDGDSRGRETVRISVRASGEDGAGFCEHPSISADGRYVVFESGAENLIVPDGNGLRDIFLKDRATGELRNLTRVPLSVLADETQPLTLRLRDAFSPVVSADGRVVAFLSKGGFDGSLAGARDVIHVLDRSTGVFRKAFVPVAGEPDADYSDLTMSDDGRTLAFVSRAANLGFSNPSAYAQVYTVDLRVEPPALTLVSRSMSSATAVADAACAQARLSRDGRTVVFAGRANNLAGLTGLPEAIYLASPPGAAVKLVSVAAGTSTRATGSFIYPAVSGDGRYVAFYAQSRDLFGPPNFLGVHLALVDLGVTPPKISYAGDNAYVQMNPYVFPSGQPLSISDGGRIAYADRNNPGQIWVRTVEGVYSTVSHASNGEPGALPSSYPAISADGLWVVWSSNADNLSGGDVNLGQDIFIHGPLR